MERSSFFNAVLNGETYDRVYTAEDYARYFASFIDNGVFPTPSTNLQVIADGTTMDIVLKVGKAWINGYFYDLTDDLTLNVDVADGVLNRIDRAVLRLDFINREIKAYVKKGTFASSPVVPSLVRNADIYELGIADIKVNKGVTKIVQADITDLRGNSNLCGYVAGVVQQIDTTDLFTQFQSTFDLWFEAIKGQLSTDAAGNLQNQLDIIKPLADSWIDFKTNGGTLFNSLELKSLSSIVDVINTTKQYLGLNAGTKGIVIDESANALRPSSTSKDNMAVGTRDYSFKDLYLSIKGGNENEGYTKIANGYILQWGHANCKVKVGTEYTTTITFPIAFPNDCIMVIPVAQLNSRVGGTAGVGSVIINAIPLGGNSKAEILTNAVNSVGLSTVDNNIFTGWIAIGN